MKKALLALPLLILIVLIPGCLKGADVQDVEISSEGVKIVSLSVDKNPAQSQELIGFLLRVQNIGEIPARDVSLCIKRMGEFEFPEAASCDYSQKPTADLNAPDARVGMPGQTYEKYWQADTPAVQFPLKQPITAEVAYTYSTVATKEIPILTKGRLDELRESTAELYQGTSTLTQSPIKLEIQNKDPVQIDATGTKTFSFDIVLTNIEKGYIKAEYMDEDQDGKADLPGWCTENLNCIESLKVELFDNNIETDYITCEDEDGIYINTGGTLVELEGIHLWQGKDARVKCQMAVDLNQGGNPGAGMDSERYPVITATAAYKYHIETTLDMEVLP